MNQITEPVSLTQDGYAELVAELKELKDNKLPAAIDRVARARDFGDLSENSEYQNARENLSFLEGRIEELEDLVSRAKIIKAKKTSKKAVTLGSKVTVNGGGKTHTFTIVGEYEADPTEKKISHDSPLGKALLGKKIGEEVEYEAPVGKILYQIKRID